MKRTKLSPANSDGHSLRTYVPKAIVDHYGLKKGDELEWNITASGSKIEIYIKPIKKKLGPGR